MNMYLAIGDTSGDGHGRNEKVLIDCNKSIKSIQVAYRESCEKTGIPFHENICSEYGDNIIREEVQIELKTHNIDFDFSVLDPCDDGSEDCYIYVDQYVDLFMAFVGISMPDPFIWSRTEEKNQIPIINDSNNFREWLGYGLFE